APQALLQGLLGIEREAGRRRDGDAGRWGPRVLDLDLLLYGAHVLDEPGLQVPHPYLHQRAFVLAPLAEIAPQAVIPGHASVAAVLETVDATGVQALAGDLAPSMARCVAASRPGPGGVLRDNARLPNRNP